jgi:hypothetical protein
MNKLPEWPAQNGFWSAVAGRLLPLTAGSVAVAYLPGILAPATTLRWAILSVMVPLTLLVVSRSRSSGEVIRAHWIIVALPAYSLLSVLWALSWSEALNGWWQLSLFCCSILLGSLVPVSNLEATYRVFVLGLLPSVAVAILQARNWPTWGIESLSNYPSGLFMNSQLFGEISALGFLLAPVAGIVQLTLLLAVVLSGSRAAMLAVALTGIVLYAVTVRKGRSQPLDPRQLAGILAGLAGMAFGLFQALAKSSGAANDLGPFGGGLAGVSAGRWPLWLDTARGVSAFGNGIGSFFVEFPRYIQAFPLINAGGRPEFAENEFLHFAFELGVPGVLLLGGIFVSALVNSSSLKQRLVVVALIVEACFGFPLHMPATVFLGGLVLGDCLRRAERRGPDHGHAVTAREGLSPG